MISSDTTPSVRTSPLSSDTLRPMSSDAARLVRTPHHWSGHRAISPDTASPLDRTPSAPLVRTSTAPLVRTTPHGSDNHRPISLDTAPLVRLPPSISSYNRCPIGSDTCRPISSDTRRPSSSYLCRPISSDAAAVVRTPAGPLLRIPPINSDTAILVRTPPH